MRYAVYHRSRGCRTWQLVAESTGGYFVEARGISQARLEAWANLRAQLLCKIDNIGVAECEPGRRPQGLLARCIHE